MAQCIIPLLSSHSKSLTPLLPKYPNITFILENKGVLNDDPLPVCPWDDDRSFNNSRNPRFPHFCLSAVLEVNRRGLFLASSSTTAGQIQAHPSLSYGMPSQKHHCYSSVEMVKNQQNPTAQVTELPLAKPSNGSWTTSMDHAPRKEHKGVAFPQASKPPDPPEGTTTGALSSCGPPHPVTGALPVGHRGTVLCSSMANIHFHSQQVWNQERRQLSHWLRPLCNTQSYRGAPRTNLADSRGAHPTRIWTSAHWWWGLMCCNTR